MFHRQWESDSHLYGGKIAHRRHRAAHRHRHAARHHSAPCRHFSARCCRRDTFLCCLLPSLPRPPVAVIMPPVVLLYIAAVRVVVPPITIAVPPVTMLPLAVVVPPRCAACRLQCRLRCLAAGCHGLCRYYVCDGWRSVGCSTYITYCHVGYLKRRVFSEKTNFLDHDDTP